MKKIKCMIDDLCEELKGAQHYAEVYVERKAAGGSQWASRYHGMAEDELRHAEYIHEDIVQEIERIRSVFVPPDDMMSMWEEEHKEYVRKAAWIKQMLDM